MGRPSASAENRAFSVFFAHAVTKKSHSRLDFVARSGPLSLFSSLARMFPAYARTEDGQGFRDGVSEVQFNKELQKNGFLRVRDRRTCATRRSEDPTGAGMYLFSHLKWRDPSDAEDREVLVGKYNEMVKKFPLITLGFKMEKLMDIVGKFHKDWEVSTEAMGFDAEEESDNSDNHQPAQRSTSVSPGIGMNAHQARFLAEAQAQALNNPLFQQGSNPLSLGMAQAFPMGAMNMGVPSAQDLNALQSQLTSSLLAVTLAKQQLQQAQSMPLGDISMQKAFINSFQNPAGVNPFNLQQALLSKPQQAMAQLSPMQLQGQLPQLQMGMS
mmetsp:Transcript_51671/g.121306  ORF Transcript_51671/g.121306 Transcript_51671/m.121306 type:complete len:327 (-) Transcript_51671:52-1032(-)|eukprot:3573028-Rhodomonas_salina.2